MGKYKQEHLKMKDGRLQWVGWMRERGCNPKALGTNPKAKGTNLKARGLNPRALGTNPRAKRVQP